MLDLISILIWILIAFGLMPIRSRNLGHMVFKGEMGTCDLFNPETENISGIYQLKSITIDKVPLTIWFILPQQSIANDRVNDKTYYMDQLAQSDRVILYVYGIADKVPFLHRTQLYSRLREGYYVIAFDYRGNGAACNVKPSNRGMYRDTQFVINLILARTNAKVFVWGHDGGAAIATGALTKMAYQSQIGGVILETPITNLKEKFAIEMGQPMLMLMGWFLRRYNLRYAADTYIPSLKYRLLIMQAEGDTDTPVSFGQKLYDLAFQSRIDVTLKTFGAIYDHYNIPWAPDFLTIVQKFTDTPIPPIL